MFPSVAYIEIPGFESRSEHGKYLLFEMYFSHSSSE